MTKYYVEDLVRAAGFRMVTAAPARADSLIHRLGETEFNQDLGADLIKRGGHLITSGPFGEVRLFDTAVALLKPEEESPVRCLYTFSSESFFGRTAVREQHLWRIDADRAVRIGGKPPSAYMLFEVLVPRFGAVISGEEYTAAGERWHKKQVAEAIKSGLTVYLSNEFGALFEATSFNEVVKREKLVWGVGDRFKERRVVICERPL